MYSLIIPLYDMQMAQDKYMFHPMFLSSELDLASNQNIHESVPVSKYGPYLKGTYGQGVPQTSEDKQIANTFFEVATTYSTDESMSDILFDKRTSAQEKVIAFIPQWLKLTEPLVESAQLLNKSVTRHLAPYKNGDIPQRHDNDMAYMMAIFYASTQLASVALDIQHPSQTNMDLARHALNSGRSMVGGFSDEPLPQTNLLIPPFVKAQDTRKVEILKLKTATLNVRAQKAAERVLSLAAAVEGKKEINLMISQHEPLHLFDQD